MNLPRLVGTALLTTIVLTLGCSGSEFDSAESCCDQELAATELSGTSLYQLESVWYDDSGAATHLAELHGTPVLMALMFTRCAYACPRILADLQAIETALPAATRDQIQFVLVSIDPERDHPADLREYRTTQQLDADRWTLLCGNASGIRELSAALGFNYSRGENGDYSHSNQITVLDAQGELIHQQHGLGTDPGDTLAVISERITPQ